MIKADFAVNGRAPDTELADLAAATASGVYTIVLNASLGELGNARVFAEIADNQGNITRVAQHFSTVIASGNMILISGFE